MSFEDFVDDREAIKAEYQRYVDEKTQHPEN